MIWDLIRDFIVEHITGGVNSGDELFSCSIGQYFYTEDLIYSVGINNATADKSPLYMNIGDWLATTLTIICMCLIVAFAIWLIIWVFKAVAHAFLLRR